MDRPIRTYLLTAGLLAITLTGCARSVRVEPVTPAELDALDEALVQHATDADELARIGVRFYQAGRYTRAVDVLGAALTLDPDAFPAIVYRGLGFEALVQFDSARVTYENGRARRISRGERRELEGRLTLLARTRLSAEIRQALARESTLAAVAPPPNTIAVLPWLYVGSNPEYRALERGIAHLLVSDLAKIGRITLLERERVQALVDELQLAGQGRLDEATAARSGLLLGAAHVLQGSIREAPGNGVMALEAQVVHTMSAKVAATGGATDRLQQLFAMEKAIVFQVLEQLGIEPTPAERRAISERPTADLQAFLAFSRGLEAQDRGDPSTASGFFSSAAVRDPAFRAARDRATASQGAVQATEATARIASSIHVGASPGTGRDRVGTLRNAVQFVVPGAGGQIDRRALSRPPVSKPRVPEALGQDNPSTITAIGDIIIIIPRPR